MCHLRNFYCYSELLCGKQMTVRNLTKATRNHNVSGLGGYYVYLGWGIRWHNMTLKWFRK